ncbi:hypothetical protein [Xanthocytophaga flava]|nr:hypothetical protein [Xanthocytophaga flavus]MDJ1467500.1 hypothetical protein [Xanthocytophaga flavus]
MCTANETNVYSFQMTNKKTASLCKEKSDKYLVYRFGTTAKTELQYPEQLDESSWKKFTFRYYQRTGGKEADAKDLNWLSFSNKGTEYTVYSEFYSQSNSSKVGIMVTTMEGKDIDIKGLAQTQTGKITSFKQSAKIDKEEY